MPWKRTGGIARSLTGALLLVGVSLTGLAACAARGPDGEGGGTLRHSPVQLDEEGRDRTGRLLWRGGIALTGATAAFGGLSDLWVAPDGGQFAAVTDAGAALTGWLVHDSSGRLVAVRDMALNPLHGEDGRPFVGKAGDAEGVVRLPDGGWLVSFEGDHRVLHYSGALGAGVPRRLDLPAEVASLPRNEGLEVLARLPDGRLLLIAEMVGSADGTSPAWLGTPGDWSAFRYSPRSPFRPVGATVLPDGDVLVLERRLSLIGGWGSRIVRLDAAALARAAAEGGVAEGEELGRIDPPMIAENYEGIGVRRDASGRTFIYLVSDDNFRATQRTLLIMFELSD